MKEILETMIANYQNKIEQSKKNRTIAGPPETMKFLFIAQEQCYEEIRNDLINLMLIYDTKK